MHETVKTSAAGPDSAIWRPASGSIVAVAAFLGALVPSTGFAQVAPTSLATQGSGWRYTASIYAYVPSVDGTSSFPADGQGTRLNLDGSKILDKLKVFAMGTAGAHNGTWGMFTDIVYLKFEASESASRDFTIGNAGLPADASAAFDWEMKGTAWTLAGEYRVASAPSYTVDVLAGTRLLDTRQHLRWNIGGSIGSLDPAARSGEIQTSQSTWDAIVGVKGRYAFGQNRQWAVPFYLDVGRRRVEVHPAGRRRARLPIRVGRGHRHVALSPLRHEVELGLAGRQLQRPADRRDVPLVDKAALRPCSSRSIRRLVARDRARSVSAPTRWPSSRPSCRRERAPT